jgi:transcriptional regulator CtsR
MIIGDYSLAKAIRTILKKLENSVSKDKIREIIKIIEKYSQMAKEEINVKILIADSNSLNYGREEAHNADIYHLKQLLEEE